jgi:sigma-B regulation protein RsbU (phosphoserine phosphatase)
MQGETAETVLIVDDTADNLRLLAQMLAEGGYDVRAATSGTRALELAAADPPDLVLLDIRMPEMDGFEVCRQLKADRKTQHIPVVFISALNEVQDKLRGFEVGGVDYVTKPFQVEEVLARARTHLALRRFEQRMEEANRRFQEELELAGQVQASFLPRSGPELPGWEFALTLKPARETSGDFYDVLELPNGQLGLLVGDVADKGAAAALFMAMSWSLIRTFVERHLGEPEKAPASVNDRLVGDAHASRFVTVLLAIVDPASGKLSYANAGHPPAYLVRASGETLALERTGPLLGMLADQGWRRGEAEMQSGDVLVMYTDGVTEAMNAAGEPYGSDRLKAVLRASAAGTAESVVHAVLAGVNEFVGDALQTDDLALVALDRTG